MLSSVLDLRITVEPLLGCCGRDDEEEEEEAIELFLMVGMRDNGETQKKRSEERRVGKECRN